MEDIWFEICKYIKLGDLSVYVQYVCKVANVAAWKHIREQRDRNKPFKINIRRLVEENKYILQPVRYADNFGYDIWLTACNFQICPKNHPKYNINRRIRFICESKRNAGIKQYDI